MRSILSASCFLVLGWFASAQVPDQKPTVKVTSRLVQVSVVVHDKKGQPIRNLTKDDFVLYDQGKPQEISTFAKMTDEAPPANFMPLPPDVISNRLANSNGSGPARLMALPNTVTVILVDGLNTATLDQHYTQEAMIKFLQQIQPGDRVALYTLTNGLRVLHDFSSDTASLLAALNRHQTQDSFLANGSSYEDSSTGTDYIDALADTLNERISTFYQEQRTQVTLDALTAVAGHLSGMPGRKNVIWLSSSFPSLVGQNADGSYSRDFRTFDLEMQRTLRALNDTGVAIYPVDVRGLIGEFGYMPSMNASSRPRMSRGMDLAPMDQRAQRDILNSQSTMFDIADRTGGRAFMNTNDVTQSIRKAVDDARITYILGYSPNHENWDGRYREIKLTLKRSGLEARYRQGYFATPERADTTTVREQALEAAVNAPLLATGLGIMAKIAVWPTQDKPQTTIGAVLDAKELLFNLNEQGEQEASLDLVATVFDDQRQPLSQIERIVHLSFKPVQFTPTMNTGLKLDVEVDTPLKSDHVRLVFRDTGSGATGAIDIPLKVRTGGTSRK
jgi:VWFA-related protein